MSFVGVLIPVHNLSWLWNDSVHCHREGKLELNPSSGGERESHPPIIQKEKSVVLPTLRGYKFTTRLLSNLI